MKKLFLLIVALVSLTPAFAAKVSQSAAADYGMRFLQAMGAPGRTSPKVVMANEAFYVINYYPQGWVIVSADDRLNPVIGYSTTSAINLMSIPDNMMGVLRRFEQDAREGMQVATPADVRWVEIDSPMRSRGSSAPISELIPVKWNQPAPFNKYCPGNGESKAIVGCVAVAMSQAMAVQQWPDRPTGTMTYKPANYGTISLNYNGERAYNWNDILSGANNYDEAARLMYHAGVSVRMDYGPDGSGIPSNDAERMSTALRNNFKYANARVIWRDDYRGDWEQLLINELLAGCAIVYNGVDSKNNAGHSFNLDGYDGNGRFHVNWGWGGSGNGYFTVNGLNNSGYKFNEWQVAAIGILAPTRPIHSLELSENRIEEGLEAGAVVGLITVNGGQFDPSVHTVTVRGVWNQKQNKYSDVPFAIANGNMLVTTEVLSSKTPTYNIELNVAENQEGTEFTQGQVITVKAFEPIEKATSIAFDRAAGKFTVSTKHNVTYSLRTAGGRTTSGKIEPLPQLTIMLGDLDAGSNTLTLSCGSDSKTITIVK